MEYLVDENGFEYVSLALQGCYLCEHSKLDFSDNPCNKCTFGLGEERNYFQPKESEVK